MATPHIAGLAALLWQAKPGATVNEIESAILRSCIRPKAMSQERANRGVPDAAKALAILRDGTASGGAKKRTTRKTAKGRPVKKTRASKSKRVKKK
jgi:hypothetical protein